ncbi:MAG: MIP/aquaporin family protein [Candidatus Sulfotelmatobacter sp.]
MTESLNRRTLCEGLGTCLLTTAVVGSGIMADRLAGNNAAIALLANTIATGAALVALILTFAPISGAHINPAVTLSLAAKGLMRWHEATAYVLAQFAGGVVGTVLAHVMFAVPLLSLSHHQRAGLPQLISEFVATFGLLVIIWASVRAKHSVLAIAIAVATYITAAYWFTSSTSFANPAVTLARCITDTFSGIRPVDAPGFVVAQVLGALTATTLCSWLFRLPHRSACLSGSTGRPGTIRSS